MKWFLLILILLSACAAPVPTIEKYYVAPGGTIEQGIESDVPLIKFTWVFPI